MGMLINGQWQTNQQLRTNDAGEFVRSDSTFRQWISAKNSEFTAQSGRYVLFVNAGCPWAYRTILYRQLKNLSNHIEISFTLPAGTQHGWQFDGNEAILGAGYLYQVYQQADDNFSGRCTVPVLWDKKQRCIVNNESADIIRMLNTEFNHLPGVNSIDFYPAKLQNDIDALNEKIYHSINNGVYRCGFARSQSAYDEAVALLFANLDELDEHLSQQRYLCGAEVTEADWRLFATLIRFDIAYHGQFRCNIKRISDYANLWPYTRDLYQYPGVAQTVDITAIKGIYYGSSRPNILPAGPLLNFDQPHNRG